MTIEALSKINELLSSVCDYEYGGWSKSPIPFPFFVGEYNEIGEEAEDGRMETDFVLTGTGRSLLELEKARETIKRTIEANERMILPSGNGLALFYSNALSVPTDNEDLYRIQINIQVYEWRTE